MTLPSSVSTSTEKPVSAFIKNMKMVHLQKGHSIDKEILFLEMYYKIFSPSLVIFLSGKSNYCPVFQRLGEAFVSQ